MPDALILVIEDDEMSRQLAVDLLKFNGYRVLEADNAASGIELAITRQPALILMDIAMPGLDGIAALRHLRAVPFTTRIPVVAFTAFAMSEDEQRLRGAGFNGYIAKPIDTRAFARHVARYLAGPEPPDAL